MIRIKHSLSLCQADIRNLYSSVLHTNDFFIFADTIIIFSNILFNIINNGDMGMFQILNKMGLLHEPSGILLVTRKYLGYSVHIKYTVSYKINFRMCGTR